MLRIRVISLSLLLALAFAGCTHELEDKMGAYLDQVEEGLADFNTHDVKDSGIHIQLITFALPHIFW